MSRDMPDREPGMVRVLGVNGAFFAEDGRYGFPRDLVAAAHSVTYVDIAARTLEVILDLHTLPTDQPLRVQLGFRCRVRDPAAVAKAHITDVFPELEAYLAGLRWLRWFAGCSPREGFALAQRRAIDQVNLRPPTIRGLQARLAYLRISGSPIDPKVIPDVRRLPETLGEQGIHQDSSPHV
jgi:hypothetical protein